MTTTRDRVCVETPYPCLTLSDLLLNTMLDDVILLLSPDLMSAAPRNVVLMSLIILFACRA
jgi:hypothetical protein